ncbi:MAG: acylneuraminate cytidylyltransferase family protein [Phycisphaeraceae bacterium]|nr:MAG: acylneuraminate cytidylyltransferase family protein [Phycisphaeraceae bacterium]
MTADPRGALAVILARAGSKGVPGKNKANLAGRPCIAWTIDAARASVAGRSGRVIVSTDDAGVAAVAASMGVGVIDRPAALADDRATVDDAARHAVLADEAGAVPRADRPVVILYGNVPVRPEGVIDRAVGLLTETGCDSVQSYQPVGKHHPWWTARLGDDGTVGPWEGDELNHGVHRRQDLPPAFVPDGAVLAVTRRALFLEIPGVRPGPHAFFGRDRRGVRNPAGSVVDIDEPMDLIVADAVLRARAAGGVGRTGSFAA